MNNYANHLYKVQCEIIDLMNKNKLTGRDSLGLMVMLCGHCISQLKNNKDMVKQFMDEMENIVRKYIENGTTAQV